MHRLRFPRRRMRGQKRPRPSHLPSPTSTQKLRADARGTPQLNRESRTVLGGASGIRRAAQDGGKTSTWARYVLVKAVKRRDK